MNFDHIVDGPYILGNTIRYIAKDEQITDVVLDRKRPIRVQVPNEDTDQFFLTLKPNIKTVSEIFSVPAKLLAISDIEGNFDGLTSFLKNNGVIDENFDWCYADGHLLINGDLVDRGAHPMHLLWLIYKLENQAQEAGGQVHVILGNHDIMNIQGWCDYAHEKHQRSVTIVTEMLDKDHAFRFLYHKNQEIGKWLRSKNTVVKIGGLLFVHGGLSHNLLPYQLSLAQINHIVRQNIEIDFYFSSTDDPLVNQVMGKKGPIWYRNLARDHEGQPKDTLRQLIDVLDYYEAQKMIIGHTVMPDICTDYEGKLIKIDVLHGKTKNSGLTKGILVEDNWIYKIDDTGRKESLLMLHDH